jgi:adenylate cyclase
MGTVGWIRRAFAVTGGRVERRLAAVLAADVAGYSRLMGSDEVGTLEALKTLRREIVDPAIAGHNGRIVKTTGDGLLVEFGSAVDAVTCAMAVQELMTERKDQSTIAFRIGINVGDIIIDGGDIFGDGVNVAARVENECEPGGVCLSDDAFRHVRGKTAFAFDDLGERSLKNIDRPVRLYAARSTSSTSATIKAPVDTAKQLSLPDRPSIAVLPFQNMSGDAEQDYFADGMVEDIITALSRFKSLFVIARNSSFTYKGKAVDIKQVGRELGVRYVLEGSVRKSGGRVRITGQLIEAATGAHIWADKIDGALEDVFELQDEVTQRVVGAIEPSITQAEINRAQEKATSNLDAYDLYLKALAVHYPQTPDDIAEALRLLDRAIELDPNYSWAKAFAAYIHAFKVTQGWVKRIDQEAGRKLAREAIVLSRDDPNTLGYAAHALAILAREYDVPISCMDRALQLNGNSANLLMRSGFMRIWVSDPDRAIDHFTRSMRLSPLDPQLGYHYAGLAGCHVMKGDFEKALEYGRRAAGEMPRWIAPWTNIAIAAAKLGKQQESQAAVQKLLTLSPGFTLALRAANSLFRDKSVEDIFVEGLRAAGVPEG